MKYYPVNLNISGRLCLVVGGGAVASRKIESLLACDAMIRVVSPEACKMIRDSAENGKIQWLRRKYCDTDVEGVFMVFAATSDQELQKAIVHQAKQKGVLLNCVDIPEACDFQLPAKIRRGDLMIAVSTGGGSPALSAQIKLQLLEEYGPEYGVLVALMAKIRGHVVGSELSEGNSKLFQKILALPLLDLIRENRWDEISGQLATVLPSAIKSDRLVSELRGERK